MPRYEFQCSSCLRVEDVHASFSDPVPQDGAPCGWQNVVGDGVVLEHEECPGTMRRVWGVPAIGAGTSGGTPARGHQRFVKGDAGWTNG